MAHQDTTVLFVPGAYHSPEGYNDVIAHLDAASYKIAKSWLPSTLRDGAAPVQDFKSDVAEIRKDLSATIDQGQKVILVLHSYGGQCGSQAAEGFDQASLAAQGHTDGRGIIHIVYLAAFMLRAGESLNSSKLESKVAGRKLENGAAIPTNAAEAFYNDFTSQAQVDQWVNNLNPWCFVVMDSVLSHEPWRKIPATYLSCTLDNAVSYGTQKRYIKNVTEAGPVKLRVVEWKTAHTPFAVRPLEVSNLIRSVVEDVPVLDEASQPTPKSNI